MRISWRLVQSCARPALNTSPHWRRAVLQPVANLIESRERPRRHDATGKLRPATADTVYSLPLEASWEPDLWGRIRNTVHESQYAAQVSAADLENERLIEQASLAEFFFEIRGQDELQENLQ